MLFQPSPRRRHGPFVTYVGKEVMASQRRPTPATRVAAASTLKAGDPCPGPSSPSSPQRFPHASKFPLYFLICLLTKPYRLNPLLYPTPPFFLSLSVFCFFFYLFISTLNFQVMENVQVKASSHVLHIILVDLRRT